MSLDSNPNIKDVAKVAGVSFKTVSRVLNNDKAVSEELRTRVAAAIRTTGYVPNAGARAMRSGKSGVVGFLSDVIATTPYSFEIVHGVQDALAECGLSMLMGNTGGNPEQEARQVNLFLQSRVDGIIFASMFHKEVELPEIPPGIATVTVNCFDRAGALSAVVPDDEQIGRTAAEYLIGKGHRRIAYLTLTKNIIATKLRTCGFMQAVKAAGLPAAGVSVRPSRRITSKGDEISLAGKMICELFDAPGEPTAILAANDPEAMPIMASLRRLGLSIPGDVSVLGIDDYRLICERMDPPLTSIGLPYYEMGRRAVELLLQPEEPGRDVRIERIPGPLVERESVAKPKRAPSGGKFARVMNL
ncbi:MAG: LacI family DNA-binding transcriptional regulator [Planctomycetota bacterium]|jgi:LacI family transcriptional regulator|nr:LacI family DNA-binding transcriptional regulator [Planctomycetota bacterium]